MKHIAIALMLIVSGVATAEAGTNLPALTNYPEPNCIKPFNKLIAPQGPTTKEIAAGGMTFKTVTGNQSVTDYNKQVAQDNVDRAKYTDCVNAYVTNAQADIDMIRDMLSRSLAAKTNFPPLNNYPAPTCVKPDDIPEIAGKEDVTAYNKQVKQYNQQIAQHNADLHRYTDCMNDYVANAQADMDMIRVKVNKAVTDGKVPN